MLIPGQLSQLVLYIVLYFFQSHTISVVIARHLSLLSRTICASFLKKKQDQSPKSAASVQDYTKKL